MPSYHLPTRSNEHILSNTTNEKDYPSSQPRGLKARFLSLARPIRYALVALILLVCLLPLLGLLALRKDNDDGGSGGGGSGGGGGGGGSGSGDNLQISTSSGTYRGSLLVADPFPASSNSTLRSQSQNQVRQWLGVPFAASTEGSNRFQPPQKRSKAKGVQNAYNQSVTCPQNLGLTSKAFLKTIGVETDYEMGEDCLTANIWAPAGDRAKGNAAVLIWFYGGAYEFGANSLTTYNASRWVAAQDDIILVGVNYRMSFFGFPLSPQLQQSNNGSMNLGILDAKAAVDWVHDNIAAFGGDPDRISLFGQSAGGIQADNYLFAFPDDSNVKGVISMSGLSSFLLASQYPTAPANLSAPTSPWNALSFAMGCGATPDSDQLSCMQNIPMSRLLTAVTIDPFTFRPSPDNITFFPSYPSLLSSGSFAKVPVIASTTSEENNIYAKMAGFGHYSDALRDRMGLQNGTWDLWCAARRGIEARRQHGVESSWQITYHGDFANISPDEGLGAYHTSDISVVFGTYDFINPSVAPSATEAAVSAYMQGLYTAFARDPQNGPTNYGLTIPAGSQADVFDVALNNQAGAQESDGTDRATQYGCAARVGSA